MMKKLAAIVALTAGLTAAPAPTAAADDEVVYDIEDIQLIFKDVKTAGNCKTPRWDLEVTYGDQGQPPTDLVVDFDIYHPRGWRFDSAQYVNTLSGTTRKMCAGLDAPGRYDVTGYVVHVGPDDAYFFEKHFTYTSTKAPGPNGSSRLLARKRPTGTQSWEVQGVLTKGGSGNALPNQQVILQRKQGGAWRNVRKTRTTKGGRVSIVVAQGRTGSFRLAWAGNNAARPDASPAFTLPARSR